ncbi:class I SAM-dependent methyltransferase [Actinocrispum wychmicini]|uniref:Methyltransferase family protein n=1 Tax=Actinocrispum wychmicini TaxID=1213861 RepID=A0A4R2JEP9_9PSEU|nr:class I SAM-dependent methyltransferase [Actinocrispum wychmicini]TCO54719.1 methyltransferase family protein [Actinocrispum wychmicini]
MSTTAGLSQDANDLAWAIGGSELLRRLWAEAWGDLYALEVEALSSTSWTTFGQLISYLRLQPGQVLADLGCGRGGPGLWLARAFQARLIGVDHSASLVEQARARIGHWVRPDGAEFRIGTFTESGLDDSSADAVISLGALPLGQDLDAALREISRIARPGGRVVVTFSESTEPDAVIDWADRMRLAGLEFEARHEMPEADRGWRRLCELIEDNRPELVEDMGELGASFVFNDAETYAPVLDRLRWVLVAGRRAG